MVQVLPGERGTHRVEGTPNLDKPEGMQDAGLREGNQETEEGRRPVSLG